VGPAEIEAETADDVRELLATLGLLPASNGTAPKVNPNESIQDRLRRIRERVVRAEQVKVLRVLASAEEGMTDAELAEAASLPNTGSLPGIMQALSKYAKAVGLEPHHVMNKTVRKSDAGRSYHYRLTPEMRDIMKKEKAS